MLTSRAGRAKRASFGGGGGDGSAKNAARRSAGGAQRKIYKITKVSEKVTFCE
jgi:hypothetical protein